MPPLLLLLPLLLPLLHLLLSVFVSAGGSRHWLAGGRHMPRNSQPPKPTNKQCD